MIAAAGGLSLALGFFETFREQFCGHWNWQTARPLFWFGGFLLLAALGAVLLARTSETNANRIQATYLAALALIVTYAILALAVDGLNVPFLSEDLFGGSDACAV